MGLMGPISPIQAEEPFMKAWLLTGTLALAALVVLPPGPCQAQGGKRVVPGPIWLRDYEAARTVARKTGKPLFAVFRCEA
jgi:hypothetical protein